MSELEQKYSDYCERVGPLLSQGQTLEDIRDFGEAAQYLKGELGFISSLIDEYSRSHIGTVGGNSVVYACLIEILAWQFKIANFRQCADISKAKVAAIRCLCMVSTHAISIDSLSQRADQVHLHRALFHYIHDYTKCMNARDQYDRKLVSRNPEIFGAYKTASRSIPRLTLNEDIDSETIERNVANPSEELVWVLLNACKRIKQEGLNDKDIHYVDAVCSMAEMYVTIDAIARHVAEKYDAIEQ